VAQRGGKKGDEARLVLNNYALSGGDMAAFLVAGAAVGMLLGLRFKVLVLVPAILLATVVIILSGGGQKLSVILLTLVGTVVSLQMGYIAGCVLRFLAGTYLSALTRYHRPGTKC
jgi:hypothetical protein